jgi:hypothetical protein
MGKITVDLRFMKMFVTIDKFNTSFHRIVMQGKDQIRPRPDDNEKFSDALPTERNGVQGIEGSNFLGVAW